MSASLTGLGAVTLFVEDLPQAAAFYRDVFGLPPVADDEDATAFRFGSTVLNPLRVHAAPELIEPARVAGPGAGSRVHVTVRVADVDAVCAEPAGHLWEVAQSPASA